MWLATLAPGELSHVVEGKQGSVEGEQGANFRSGSIARRFVPPSAPHGRGVGRLPSDCHAAAVEAREGEAVEGLAEGSALVPQHADSHFLADRH
jgi:hypothetical protein